MGSRPRDGLDGCHYANYPTVSKGILRCIQGGAGKVERRITSRKITGLGEL